MDLHSEMLMQEFLNNKEVFSKMQEIVSNRLDKIIKDLNMLVNNVESRVKTQKSLAGKLELKGSKYKTLQDITDILGARIITFYSDEVDKIAAEIEKIFDVDFENSIDKRKIYKVDQFGYMSLHYICRIPKELFYDETLPLVNEFRFEIQIRTTLQHVWASIYHDTGYKTDVEVPREYLRSLNRLAGLLELADSEFSRIKSSLGDYRRKVKSVVKSGKFEDIELNLDSFKEYLEIKPFDALNRRIADTNNMEIEELSLYPFLSLFKNVCGCKTLEDIHNVVVQESETAYQLAIRQFSGTDLDIMSSFTGPLSLCYVVLIKNGSGQKGIVRLLEEIYGKRPSNERFANKITDIAKNMGLLVK